jgi:NADH-ubiquinone oxidoreductase chain 5
MVTAGIFLIIRCSVIFEFSQNILSCLIFWGLVTVVISGLIANFQTDLKKIIAYSTCSQLGYMVIACGMSDYLLALFHLVNHACFKALLFLAAGAVIHNFLNEQDLRKLSATHELSPLLSTCFDIGALCLSAFPFFGGFYTKDLIIESGSVPTFGFNSLVYYFGLFGAMLTIGYSSLITEVNTEEEIYVYKKFYFIKEDVGLFFGVPLIVLSILSLFSGYYLKFFFDNSMNIFFESVFIYPRTAVLLQARDYAPFYIQIFPLFLGFFFIFCFNGSFFSQQPLFYFFKQPDFNKKSNSIFYSAERLFVNKFYFDELFYHYVISRFFSFSLLTFEVFDKGLLEIFGPKGIF